MADEEKTEQATPRKRKQSRSEGNVTKSVEINSVFMLLTGVVSLYYFAYFLYNNILRVMRQCFGFAEIPNFSQVFSINLLNTYAIKLGLIVLPIMSALFLTALVVNIAQVGFQISFKPLEPKFSKLNIFSGFGKLFSVKSLAELVKNLFKLVVIGIVIYMAVKGEVGNLFQLYDSSVAYIFLYILKVAFKLFIYVLIVMLFIAILDYAFQKWKFNKDLMMSMQEIKDETKQAEGDPLIKSRIRTLQMQAAKKRMIQAVPEADVVVTNPTHLALAIKYDALTMTAPQILAKGAGKIAEKIREIAKENNVPVVENKELAQNLYKIVDVGDEIPFELFKAVAELLAYVYKLKGKSVG